MIRPLPSLAASLQPLGSTYRRPHPTALGGFTALSSWAASRRLLPLLLLPLVLLAAGAAPVRQDDGSSDTIAELRRRLDAQQEQIDALQEDTSGDSAATDQLPPLSAFLAGAGKDEHQPEYGSTATVLNTHGFLHFVYTDRESMNSEFDLHHANLFFGADLGDSAQGWVELEYEQGGEQFELDQAEIRVFHGNTTAGFGRFYAPFGIERFSWYPPINTTLSRPDIFRHIVPGNWYETGVRVDHTQAVGDWQLRVEVAATNGLGNTANTDIRDARQATDNNDSKAIIERVGLSPTDSFTFGLSAANMTYSGDDSIDFLGFDVEYDCQPLLLRAEGIRSAVEDSSSGDFQREGFYLLGSYEIPLCEDQNLIFAGRYDILDGNDNLVDAQDYSAYTFSASWVPQPHMIFRAEVRSFSSRHGSTPVDDHIVALALVLDF